VGLSEDTIAELERAAVIAGRATEVGGRFLA
jgi:hypothetical protein